MLYIPFHICYNKGEWVKCARWVLFMLCFSLSTFQR